jgi:uncharacterized DUF497 family protein
MFRWNEWNIEHVAAHGVTAGDAEIVVRSARKPFPRRIDDDKWIVWGQNESGRFLQVIFVVDSNNDVFVVHARPLTDLEKRRFRRRRRR